MTASMAIPPVQKESGQRRTDEVAAGSNGFDAIHEFGKSAFFQDVTAYSQVHSAIEEFLVLMHGEEDYSTREFALRHCPYYVETIFHRHVNIEHGDVRALLLDVL